MHVRVCVHMCVCLGHVPYDLQVAGNVYIRGYGYIECSLSGHNKLEQASGASGSSLAVPDFTGRR